MRVPIYIDRFFEANLIRIIKEEIYKTNLVDIKLCLEKSKDPFMCPDRVWVTVVKESDENESAIR